MYLAGTAINASDALLDAVTEPLIDQIWIFFIIDDGISNRLIDFANLSIRGDYLFKKIELNGDALVIQSVS